MIIYHSLCPNCLGNVYKPIKMFHIKIVFDFIMDYPCSVCALECHQDNIQCSKCKKWVHSKCANLSSKDLQNWSATHLSFLCKCCVFTGINYDASAALAR